MTRHMIWASGTADGPIVAWLARLQAPAIEVGTGLVDCGSQFVESQPSGHLDHHMFRRDCHDIAQQHGVEQ
jgi:hypothetical protein